MVARWGVALLFGLAACSQPNHLGNPLMLPLNGLSTAIENASYDRQRRLVKSFLTEKAATMRAEQFSGSATDALLGTIPMQHREKVRHELRDAAQYPDFVERATVIVMVHRS